MTHLTPKDLKTFDAGVKERYEETLEQALKRCYGNASKTLYSQAQIAARDLTMVMTGRPDPGPQASLATPIVTINKHDVRQVTAYWYAKGLSPATINKRLNCLSKMGVSVEGLRVKNPKSLKWFLREDIKPQLLQWLRDTDGSQFHILADFIEWTTLTGLRIEESLRLTYGDFDAALSSVKVSGTKTASSQATLPLGNKAAAVIHGLMLRDPYCNDGSIRSRKVFKTDYDELQTCWDYVRTYWRWKDDPTATLKALRRSAARYLHVDCGMPLHMVQQYLRHESMDTTLEYLRLTGGYGTEEMRRYLK